MATRVKSRPTKLRIIEGAKSYSHLVTYDLYDAKSSDYDKVDRILDDKFSGEEQSTSTTWVVRHKSADSKIVFEEIKQEMNKLKRSNKTQFSDFELVVGQTVGNITST